MGNVKLIESDGELLLQRYLLDYTDKKKEEVRKERRQRDLIQALSEDYLLVCSFNLDTQAGEALRVSGEQAPQARRRSSPGDLTLDGCLGGYIDEAVVDEDKAMLREALSAEEPSSTRLADGASHPRELPHQPWRRHRVLPSHRRAQAAIGPMAHNVVLGLRSVDVQTREEMKKQALSGRGPHPGQQGQRRQERLPLEHVPRHPHAHERHRGLHHSGCQPPRSAGDECRSTWTRSSPPARIS